MGSNVKLGLAARYRPQSHQGTQPSSPLTLAAAVSHLQGLSLMLTGASPPSPSCRACHSFSPMKARVWLMKSSGSFIYAKLLIILELTA